ncbi:energy transducer TonB [Chitinilyticum litopenaei]|uniref:energy transducer TonB n=1 Tax=Chitinilyticum litopenaei TaxID=1121276 RepID=UPI00130E61C7|nr:TonB family protein [Chitinilyticum litopenaei]
MQMHRHGLLDREERKGLSLALALAMHVLLALGLLLSVQWKTQQPKPMQVELWGGPPPAPVPERVIEPEIVKPVKIKPEPKVEEKPADIGEKVKPTPKPKPSATPTPTPRPTATPTPVKATPRPTAVPVKPTPAAKPSPKPKPKQDDGDLASILSTDNLAKSDSTVKAQPGGKPGGTGTNPKAQGNTGTGTGSGIGKGYTDQIGNQIRSRIVYSNDKANPEVVYRILLFPSGEIRDISLLRASGDAQWDKAVEDAIRRSAPFPKPPGGASFSEFNGIEWKFRPKN